MGLAQGPQASLPCWVTGHPLGFPACCGRSDSAPALATLADLHAGPRRRLPAEEEPVAPPRAQMPRRPLCSRGPCWAAAAVSASQTHGVTPPTPWPHTEDDPCSPVTHWRFCGSLEEMKSPALFKWTDAAPVETHASLTRPERPPSRPHAPQLPGPGADTWGLPAAHSRGVT